jgi:hypothetical protein
VKQLQAWQDAAAEYDLEVVSVSRWPLQLRAREGSVEVQIETCGDNARSTRIVVSVPGLPDFAKVRIRREPRFWQTREIEIGDTLFDRTFFIEGPILQVLTLLDAKTRRLLLRVNAESRLEISGGALRAEGISDDRFPYLLHLLLDIGQRLVQPLDVPRRLAENAHRDPKAKVRLQNLLLLIREFPRNPETLEALHRACSDRSSEIRLVAAKGLGDEGRDVIRALARRMVVDTVSAESVSILGRELPVKRMQAILDRSLRKRRFQTARACLEVLGQSGDATDIEPQLLLALQHEEMGIRIAAANALGRAGSTAAVLPLKEAAEKGTSELRRAARQAIGEIQSRLQGASPGQLSLAENEAGQLSIADTEAGRLSLATDPAGQLSLPPEEPD